MLRAFLSGSCVCCVLAATSGGSAQEYDGPAPVNTTASLSAGADEDIQIQPRNAPTHSDQPEHPLGTYAGVVPGANATPAVPVAKTETKPMITWPGFQMRQDGTSRVFIQSTTALSPQPSTAGPKFSVYLPGAKVAGNTNKLPLETRFFNTPVARVNIEQQRDGVTLVLDLRAEVSPVVSSERGPTGYYFLYIDLPKGTFVKTPAPAQTAADAQPVPDHSKSAASVQTQASAHGKGDAEASSREAKASTHVAAKGGIRLGP